uniref:protein-tyrosine-phosphatase n=1 Tax=Malurus cyaneus samueli TaxID=2593467 RepID=A0A8C5U3D7_9PASS
KYRAETEGAARRENRYNYKEVAVIFLVASSSLFPAMSPSLQAGCALPRAVEQFHYLLWPDHGVPRNPSQLLCLVEVVNKRVLEVPAGPVLVHCSAGIGRTGTFIALDFLLKMGKAEGRVDVFHCVQQLREQRVSMVQTKVRRVTRSLHISVLALSFSRLWHSHL